MLIGYCLLESEGRPADGGSTVSTRSASGDSPRHNGGRTVPADDSPLRALGCEHLFTDIDDDRRAERPGLKAALDFLRLGDVLVVPSLTHLGPDLDSVVRLVAALSERGITIRLGSMPMDMTIPSGEALAFACRALVEMALPGPAAGEASETPRRRGRPQSLSAKDIAKARRLLAGGNAVPDVARALGVSPATVYRIFPRRSTKTGDPDDTTP